VRLFPRRGGAPTATSPATPQGLLAGRRILIVDDDDELRHLLRTVLEMEGALVSEADGARRAVEVAGRAPCDVVITDITMGHTRRDGLRLLDRLRASAQLATIPVVALTGCRELRSELTGRGFDCVLIKPIEVVELPSVIGRVLRGNHPPVALDQRGAA
jgi:DNA-binding response OmpR family regulator